MKTKNEICEKTGKYRYNSEAKATRAMNRYSDIKRVYFCSHCEGFHTTSQSVMETLEHTEVPCEEENIMLRKLNNRQSDEISKLKKELAKTKIVLKNSSEATKNWRNKCNKQRVFIKHHPDLSEEIKTKFKELWKNIVTF